MLKWALEGIGLASVLFALGCSGSSGSADASNPGAGGMGGIGGSGGTAAFDPAPFLGAWTETLAVIGTLCPNVNPVSAAGPITVTVGTSSDLVRTEPALDGCSIPLNIRTRQNATLARAIQCVTSAGTFDFNEWAMSTSDGTTGSDSAYATLTIAGAGTCPVNLTTTLTR
jgi:hypothetical protein